MDVVKSIMSVGDTRLVARVTPPWLFRRNSDEDDVVVVVVGTMNPSVVVNTHDVINPTTAQMRRSDTDVVVAPILTSIR